MTAINPIGSNQSGKPGVPEDPEPPVVVGGGVVVGRGVGVGAVGVGVGRRRRAAQASAWGPVPRNDRHVRRGLNALNAIRGRRHSHLGSRGSVVHAAQARGNARRSGISQGRRRRPCEGQDDRVPVRGDKRAGSGEDARERAVGNL